jgi:hypothetical protein
MPTREIILDENRRLQLEKNINDMLSNGIDEDGIASFVSEYKSKFGQPLKKKDVSFGSELPYAKTSFDAPSPSIENISQSKLASPSPKVVVKEEVDAIQKELGKVNPIGRINLYKDALAKTEQRFNENLAVYKQAEESGDELALEQIKPFLQQDGLKAETLKKGIEGQKKLAQLKEPNSVSNILGIGFEAAVGKLLSAPQDFDRATNVLVAEGLDALGLGGTKMLEDVDKFNQKAKEKGMITPNEITDFLAKKGVEMANNSANRSQEKNINLPYGGSGFEAIKNGDIVTASEFGSKAFLESLPTSLTFLNPYTAAATMSSMVGDEMRDAEARGEDINSTIILGGTIKAALELATERMFGAGKATKELIQTLGREGAERVVREATEEMVRKSLKKKLGQAYSEEVAGEMINQVGSNTVDKYLLGKKDVSLTDNVGEAGWTALFGAGIQGTAPVVIKHIIDKKKIVEADRLKQTASQLMDDAVNQQDLAIRETIEAKAEKLNDESDFIIEEQNQIGDLISEETLGKINETNSRIELIDATLQSDVSDITKEALIEEKTNLEAQQEELIKQATIELQTIKPINEAKKTENLQVEPTSTEGINLPNEPITPITDTQKAEEVGGVLRDALRDVESTAKVIDNKTKQELLDERLKKIKEIKDKAEGTREEMTKRYQELVTELGDDTAAIKKLQEEINARAKKEIDKLPELPKTDNELINEKGENDFIKIKKELGFKSNDYSWGKSPMDEDMGDMLLSKDKESVIFIKPNEVEVYDEVNDQTDEITNGVKIELVTTREKSRGQGKAKELIQKVTDWADKNNTDLHLDIAPQDKSTTESGLKKLYESFGFEFDGINGTRKPKSESLLSKEQTPQAETPTVQIEQLRVAEQAEYDAMTDPNDVAKKEEIYNKYDKLITPLLEQEAKNNLINNQDEKTNDRKPAAGNRLFNEPIKEIGAIADKYFKRVFGKERPKFKGTKKFDEALSRKIADAYAKMENNPNSKEVKAAYNALVKETIAQYKALKEAGYEVEINKGDPYNNSQEMIDDVVKNKTIKIFSTEEGFGDNPITEQNRKENPMLQQSGIKDKNGVPLLNNDLFRAVHDIIGHGELGNSFGAIGEENAFQIHARLYSPLARKALATETRGQNSFVNFSGINDKVSLMVKEARKLRAEGKETEAQKIVTEIYKELSYAEQKIGILPKEFYTIDESFEGEVQINNEKEKVDTKAERDRQIELLDTEKKIAQLEKEMRYAPIRPSKGVLSKKQIRIQIKNYKNQLRELKGLPPRKVITDSVFRINLRAFGTEVDENNLPNEERVVLEAMGRLDANDKDIVSSDGNAKLRQQGALKTKGGDSIDQIVSDYINENLLDSDIAPNLRDAIIRFVDKGDAYAYMDNIKEREAQNDPDAIRDEEYYNYGYQGAIDYELTDEEISELEQEIGKLNDITQEEYEKIKQEFSDTQAGEGTNRLEDKADSGKPSKSERKAIAEAKIDDIAQALKDFLPSVKGVKTSGVTQDKVIDLIAEAVKTLVNAGIEINEAIKQVKERLSETFNVDELSDFDIKMTIAKNDLQPDLEKAGISYKQAIFTVNKYLREVGSEDVITKEELAEALKNKENSKEREGYKSREKTSGRSKSYAEGRVPVSEEYKADVERNRVSYTSMDMFKNAEKAIELLSSFGGDIKGLQKAYEYILTVFNDNPYRNPENAVAIELLADRFFARSQEAYKEGDLELSEELADKSNNLRLIAFNTATKAGQYNAALAVFSRATNPDAFLYFVEGQVAEQNNVTDSNSYTNTARKVKKDNAERATKEFKKKAKEIADQTAKDVAKGSPTVKSKPINSRFTQLKDKGVKRQKDALAKLKKIGFLGSNGLNNEAIEAIGELILSQLEIGIYKAATIAQRIKEMTDGKVTDAHLKEVLDNYKVDYEGKEYSLSELSEQLEKEYKKDNVNAELKKRSERAGMVEKGQKRKSLSELIELQLSENANVEAMTKAIMAEFEISESAAKALATKYVETYKRVLTERINKQLLKDLGIKNVKEIESKENSGEVKPFHQTLGGKIVGEIMAGALTTGSAVETAFMQKYGFPVLTPNMKANIRLLALRTNEAKTVLGQKVANRALITYLQSIMPTSTVSILNTLYYVSLLSGITTAAVNTLGNANTLVLQNSENFVQSIIEAAQGEPANLISSVQGKAKVKRAIANFTQSINTFLDIMAKGGGESKYYNLNQKALDSFDSEGLIPKKEDTKNLGLTRAAKLLGQIYYSIPAFINRNLPASDDAFSMSNFNTEAAREVRRDLAKTGLKGKELEDAVFEKIYGTAEIVAMAKLDAIAEINRLGLDPKKEKRLIKRITIELIQSQLDPRVQNAAKAISAENTYRGANRGATGIIGAAIPQNIVFAPFVGTVMRIVEKMVNYIPFYSIARATGFSITDIVRKNSSYVDKLFERKGVLSPKKEGELREKQIAQVVFTHAVVGVIYALTQIGWEDPEDGEIKPLLEFSGGYLGVPKPQKEMMSKETEMPPYTMRWKGTKYNYKQNPLLVPIGIMFSINSDLKRAGIKELSLTDLNYYATVVSAISMFLLNATPVANMKDFFKELGKIMDEEDVLESADIGKQFMKSFVAQIPANIATPNTYKQAFDFLDPQVFQTNTIADVMWKSVNMERIGGLIPAYDYWGRDIERYPAESTYPFRNVFDKKTDVVDKWMIKNNINTEPLNTKTLVLDLDNNISYTKKKWDEKVQLEQNKLIGVEDNELYEVDAKFRLLTQLEWANMDKTVRQNVRKAIEENLTNVKDEELFDMPLVEYTKKEAEKKVRQLFKEERQKYIRKNFNKGKE